MPRQRPSRCRILIGSGGAIRPTLLVASRADHPTDITIKAREQGWKPFRARFDEAEFAWIVSAIDWHPNARRVSR